jgi:hypothetical protein
LSNHPFWLRASRRAGAPDRPRRALARRRREPSDALRGASAAVRAARAQPCARRGRNLARGASRRLLSECCDAGVTALPAALQS